jgi:hypothetical protein
MRSALFVLTVGLSLSSCKPRDTSNTVPAENEPAAPAASRELLVHFPLLPIIEKSLWSQLLEAEGKLAAATGSGRDSAGEEVVGLAEKLRSRHPFKAEGGRLELGGLVYDKPKRRFTLPAQVEYPDPGDGRHPGEVELLLCTEGGRLHETLFITDARPLHLELLLHLSGHAKSPQPSRFRIKVVTADGTRIPVDSLIRATGGEALESPLLWEFSGSDYKDLYSPDLSGDFAIFWHAHDSVLRVVHEGIASGVVKLAPVPHPKLKNGDPVVLELIPAGE